MTGKLKLPSKKVAILGGAFDPIHVDHIELAKQCLAKGLSDEVWLTPSPSKRWDKETLFDSEARLEILSKSIEGIPKLYPCSLEVEWGEFRGAYVFFERLKTLYPNIDFHLLMGADTYAGIPDWRDPQEKGKTNGKKLLQEIPLILFSRQGYEFPDANQHQQKFGLAIQTLEVGSEIGQHSSTVIRESLERGERISDMVVVPDLVQHKYMELMSQ